MVVLRCTQKLLVPLKQVGELPHVESTTRLGDWYGNILRIDRSQHLLFISERSRLPVVIPVRESKRLREVFPDAVCGLLGQVGVAAADIADERARMSEIAFGRTRNRSLLGTLNDFASMAQQGHLIRDQPESTRELVRFLAQTPILPLGRREPDRADARRVRDSNLGLITVGRPRRSGARLFGSAWARQGFPSALRGPDPPSALPIRLPIAGATVMTVAFLCAWLIPWGVSRSDLPVRLNGG